MDETPLQRSTKLRFPLIARQRWEALSKKAKADKDLLEILEVTHGRLNILEAYLEELSSKATPPSETSFAPIPGLASRPSPSLYASPPLTPEQAMAAVSGFFKSITPLMEGVLVTTNLDSSTLELILKWPTKSGESRDGNPGHAVPVEES